ncbi:hypothetical protein N8H74_09980 [Pseudomonas sp. B2M1-30]|uniref:hypothetical protein n=1 Tax=Pseudomonas TaxID=286 RepID=UPI0021CA10DC|nr:MULTISPECIES: hypothetical protein [Pseudomonas]MCU0118581.1 hypothetical protein [Pseudomonas sp. B2M1-30]MCU7263151.1 hypothetical protein [Pseudomonas koreensis]
MDREFYLSSPLNIEGWEIVETFERFTLYDEFAERIDAALELIQEGQEHWASHLSDGEWSAESIRVMADVRRLSYHIRKQFERSRDDLPRCIRWTIGESSHPATTDSQYIAALAIDRACRVIETLERWLSGFDKDLCAGNFENLAALIADASDDFMELVEEVRHEQPHLEIEAREAAADLMGTARYYMTLANVYASPLLSSADKIRISATARKAGNSSAAIRREATIDRNQSICAHARRLLGGGRSEREIVGIISGTDSALKTSGGAVKLSTKQIRNILVAGGVLREVASQ